MPQTTISIGCAGWSVASGQRALFGAGQSVLQRYATRFTAVEINSSFYRSHRQSTYQRWADSVPEHFEFSVKLPRAITHLARLHDCQELLSAFLEEVSGLGSKLGCLLVQLPPSLSFEPAVARTFLQVLREFTPVAVVCEPRHASWFTPTADELLVAFEIGRVAADPAVTPQAALPGGFEETVYFRWHGSPKMYSSSYSPEALLNLVPQLQQNAGRQSWVIFDNTAAGAAAENALTLRHLLAPTSG